MSSVTLAPSCDNLAWAACASTTGIAGSALPCSGWMSASGRRSGDVAKRPAMAAMRDAGATASRVDSSAMIAPCEKPDRAVDLVEEGYDLVVRIGRLSDSNLVSRTLASTRMVLCASPRYLAMHGTPMHPHELARHGLVSYSYWSSGDLRRFAGPDGEVAVRTRARIQANNGDTCRAAALAHQGVILQPAFLVQHDLRAGTLVELMPGFRAAELSICAIYPTRKQLPLRVRRLLDFLVEAMRVPPWQMPPPDGA